MEKFEIIKKNKKDFLDLLLIGDEQESMIYKYLERGELFALYGDELIAASVVTDEGNGVFEIKNISVCPKFQRQGYGTKFIKYLIDFYKDKFTMMLVGTGGDTVNFYQKCGFTISHRIENFFTDNYDHPIFENGKQLKDMIYLKLTQ